MLNIKMNDWIMEKQLKLLFRKKEITVAGITGLALTEARESVGLTQSQLAHELGGYKKGWYQKRVSYYEAKEFTTDNKVIHDLIGFFGTVKVLWEYSP